MPQFVDIGTFYHLLVEASSREGLVHDSLTILHAWVNKNQPSNIHHDQVDQPSSMDQPSNTHYHLQYILHQNYFTKINQCSTWHLRDHGGGIHLLILREGRGRRKEAHLGGDGER